METFPEFRKVMDCACVQRAKFSKGYSRIDWNFLQLSALKLNLGISPSNIDQLIVRLFFFFFFFFFFFYCRIYESNVRTTVSKEGTTMTMPGKQAFNDDRFQFILTFVYCNT